MHVFVDDEAEAEEGGAERLMSAEAGAAAATRRRRRHAPPNHFICTFCYKSFDARATCEAHERESCPRNRDSAAARSEGRYRLASMYNEIKPPPVEQGA